MYKLLADTHSSMLNITSRLAVQIQHLPGWTVDWSDETPQRSRSSLTIADFMPTEEDAHELEKRAIDYIMKFLVKEFVDLTDLKGFVPAEKVLHPVQTSQVVPMQVLFKDEKYIADTIDILSQLMHDAKLTGNPQVSIQGCTLHEECEV